MCRTLCLALLCTLCASAGLAQSPAAAPTKPARAAAPKTPFYIDPAVLNLPGIIPNPPAPGSPQAEADLAELHHIEQSRTPNQIEAAKADEEEEDIFAFRTVLGPGFTAEALPLTAALGERVKNEQSVAGAALKSTFARLRPYQADSTLHPVCAVTTAHNSYPSGHALTGYLEAFTLAELLPAKRSALLARADDYAHNRLVCGVHYPSDLEASRRVAYAVFGYMLSTPKFQHDLATARAEVDSRLGEK